MYTLYILEVREAIISHRHRWCNGDIGDQFSCLHIHRKQLGAKRLHALRIHGGVPQTSFAVQCGSGAQSLEPVAAPSNLGKQGCRCVVDVQMA
jgi:hypothetical protein